ncbi:Transcription factor TGA like domain [Macleaya cordata]|uniref:Transcription factor TGA like domain n=1 Tax=Macleaya cordata TaxID=56857 RepID=A0A200Q9X0_MACCD|nr:Transcription factor TGA like domain [Macleaya cordata]
MSFDRFYDLWLHQLQLLLHQLVTAPKPHTDEQHSHTTQLIDRVMTHYDDYCRIKTHAAKHDPFSIFAASWTTSLERSLHWISGWRPTTIFHLVYTESSVRFEAQLIDHLRGRRTGDLGDLSPSQLGRVSELQCQTVREENEISAELAHWQESAGDLVSLFTVDDEPNTERLVMVLEKAEDLRLKTIKTVVEILTPQQAVEFLIAAAELQFGVRGWGLDTDQMRRDNI